LTAAVAADKLDRFAGRAGVRAAATDAERSDMSDRDNIQSLLTLRKLTRAIADAIRTQINDHLTTLAPLFRPHLVLGDHIVSGIKESTRRADQALKQVQALHDAVLPTKPFNLRRELTVPINFASAGMEITPVDYVHVVQTGSESRRITVRCPLTWTLSYAGYSPTKLADLLDTRVRGEELQRFVISHLLLHAVTTHQRGLTQIFDSLRLPITTVKTPEFGDLPITRIGVGISTFRPSDAVVLESAELTGMDAFEEVVDVDDIGRLTDPLKERLMEIARQHVPAATAP
jgi:hypothetical protein